MDSAARLIAAALPEHLRGQPAIVENRSGAGGVVGVDAVAKAAPDGYTLSFSSVGAVAVGVSLLPHLPYDPRRDLAPITIAALVPSLLVVRPGLPVRTVAELLALVRQRPGALSFGSTGPGGTPHLAMELLRLRAGGRLDITHVAYRGAAPAITALLAGEVDCAFLDLSVLLPHVREGKLRALALAARARSPVAPEIPTVAEAGVPGVEVASWYSVLAPAGTSQDRIEVLHAAFAAVLARPDIVRRFAEQGTEVVASRPEATAEFIRSEIAKWGEVVRAANIRAD
ncbi:MAG: tripartite tricarboxylate transporter substrate binding protein [Acetobacteraceae bacterium]|nr:tripartite tricarboxylate transporter substrate binding protein [Acetobacteraceae bacterium]